MRPRLATSPPPITNAAGFSVPDAVGRNWRSGAMSRSPVSTSTPPSTVPPVAVASLAAIAAASSPVAALTVDGEPPIVIVHVSPACAAAGPAGLTATSER